LKRAILPALEADFLSTGEIVMRRRSFITLLGGAAAAWSLAARAQQPAMPVIGYLGAGAPETSANAVAAFRRGLSETGYVEGRNMAIESHFAQNEFDRLPALAADLVRRRVAVIATYTLPAALAAKAATTTIPIVFNIGLDPVHAGLAASLNRPGGNVTGVTTMSDVLWSKKLGLLHELLPGAVRFALLVNPNSPLVAETTITEVQAAARTLGRQIEVLTASTNREIDMAFASLVQKQADALLVSPDTLFSSRRLQLVTLAARARIPAIYRQREYAAAGGLMSYGPNPSDQQREVGIYTGRILKGV
jgi:putative ABC transport system substrate-binding protein